MGVTLMDSPAGPSPADGPSAPPDGGRRSGSLKPVIDVIPAEAYDNPTWRGLFYFGRDLLLYGILVAALVAFPHPLVALALQVPIALVISGLFIVAHDAAHGSLFSNKRLNSVIGHIAMLPSWHIYEGWVLGHNRVHHAYTVRRDYDFVWQPYTVEEYQALSPLRQLRHRFEWSWLGAGAYYLREVWWNKMIVGTPPARWVRAIRRDRNIVIGFVATAAGVLAWAGWAQSGDALGAAWMVLRVLVLPFLGFSYIIGSFVHVHHIQPDIRWWNRREWTKFKGQMEGTTVLHAPVGLDFFIHWIMIHIPHHVDQRIPMYHLELAADALREAYPDVVHDAPLRFRDFVANTRRCKLYDYDRGQWLTYAAAEGEQLGDPSNHDGHHPMD